MPGEDLGHGTDVQDMSKGWMPCPVSAGLAPQQPEFRGGPHHFTRGSRDCWVGTSASSTVSSAAVNEPGCTRCKKVHYASQHPLNPRRDSASQQNPTARPTGPCLTGESGHAFRPRADRQARLEPLALSASCPERVVNDRAEASGKTKGAIGRRKGPSTFPWYRRVGG